MLLRFWWVQTAVVAVGYYAAGRAVDVLAISPGYATAVWPAAGIAFFLVSRWGASAVAGVALGAFAFDVMVGGPVLALGLAVGAAAQAVIAARLVRGVTWPVLLLDRGRDAALYLLLAGPVACVFGATWSTIALHLAGLLEPADLAFGWFTWWIGDAIGVVLTAPILLALFGQPRTLWRSRVASVAVPLALASVGVVVVFVAASRMQAERRQAELAARAAVVGHAIEQRVARYTDVVAATASFVAANPELTSAQFSTFATAAIGRDRDIQAIGWCPRTTPDQRSDVEAAGRAFDPTFTLRVMARDGFALVADRPLVYPLLFTEPATPFLGVDMSSEVGRAQAIAVADTSREPAATKPLYLLGGTQGFLIFAPVYTRERPERLLGVAVGGFAMNALIQSVTADIDIANLWITIVDVTSDLPEPFDGSLVEATDWSRKLPIGGRTWRIGVARMDPGSRPWQPWFVLAGGLAFVSVFAGVLLAITGARARIAATEARYRDLYENAPDMYFTVTLDGAQILECNAAATRELGYARGELVGSSLVELADNASREALERGLATLRDQGSAAVPRIAIRRKDGVHVDASVGATAIHGESEMLAARVLLRDISEIVEAERELEKRVEERTRDLVAAVNEKDVLLKEIHHRVKNNLQVISSMLNLQARQLRDPVLASAFEESQQRIQTIALVHERLYQSRDLSDIGLDEYLKSLVANVMYAQNATERGITARTEIAGISLPIQRAIPCGLIVNELLTNAVKHAFPAGRIGTIVVSIKPIGKQIELVVADDGVGLPAAKKSDSLGLDLVYAFAEQLDATLDITSEHGAAFTLRFPAD